MRADDMVCKLLNRMVGPEGFEPLYPNREKLMTAMISLRSELRRKLLTYFYTNRLARVYVRQLATALGVDSTNLSRELARLEREGLLRSEIEGRQRYYSINSQYPYLKAVFSLLQGTIGIVPTLATALHRVEGIEKAYLYGSFAKNEADASSDIDLLIVGHPDAISLAAEVARLEKILHREVSYTTRRSPHARAATWT